MNPWLILAQVGGTIALLVGCWFYRGHIDDVACSATMEKEQNNEYQTYLAYDQAIQTASRVAADKGKDDQYKFQADLTAATARAAAADDASGKLQHALTLYADGGWFKAPGQDSACIPVSTANARLGLVAHDAGVLDADGLRASKGAAACAVRLASCERWADTVEQEMKE